MTAAQLITTAREKRRAEEQPRTASCSRAGLCVRRTVHQALTGRIDALPPEFDDPPEITDAERNIEALCALVERSYWWLRRECRDVVAWPVVPTVLGTTRAHLYVPSQSLAIEVQPCTATAVRRVEPRRQHVDKVLLRWRSWQRAGHCFVGGAVVNGVPAHYEILLAERATYGVRYASAPVRYDANRAEMLERELVLAQGYIDLEQLPPKTYGRPTFECGPHPVTGEVCPLHHDCWEGEEVSA